MKPTYPAVGDGVTVRLACCIPHCRRTFRYDKGGNPWPQGHIVMCGQHWRSGPADLRARNRTLRRLLRKARRLMNAEQRIRLELRLMEWENRSWDRVKDAVIERAMGIA